MTIKIMQGDACRIPFHIRQDGTQIRPEMVADLEVTLGRLRKTYLEGGVRWEDGYWFVYLSQEETMAMAGCDYVRLRVRYVDQPWVTVQGKRATLIHVEEHPEAEVL